MLGFTVGDLHGNIPEEGIFGLLGYKSIQCSFLLRVDTIENDKVEVIRGGS